MRGFPVAEISRGHGSSSTGAPRGDLLGRQFGFTVVGILAWISNFDQCLVAGGVG